MIPDILRLIKGSDFAGVLQFLQTSGYGIMFILMLVEGPVITYIAAFAASLGIFNVFYVLILSFFGNLVGDLIFFFIGRVGKESSVQKYVHKSINDTKMGKLKMYLERNPGKTIAYCPRGKSWRFDVAGDGRSCRGKIPPEDKTSFAAAGNQRPRQGG